MPKGARRKSDEMGESLRAILTRVNSEGLKALRMLALERDTTLQAVAIEAFNDVLKSTVSERWCGIHCSANTKTGVPAPIAGVLASSPCGPPP